MMKCTLKAEDTKSVVAGVWAMPLVSESCRTRMEHGYDTKALRIPAAGVRPKGFESF
jgi:hypothetical protein